MRKILVTGGTGFIASHLVPALLKRKFEVTALSSQELDVTGAFFLDVKPDIIVHLAANTSSKKSLEDPLYDFKVNAMGTLNVLEYAKNVGAKVIYPSTKKVLPNEKGQRSPYGLSKYVAELLCQEWNKSFGIPVIINRIGNLYGHGKGGDKFWVNIFIKKAIEHQPIEVWGDGTASRDMLYVTDLVDLLVDEVENFDKYTGELVECGGGKENVLSIKGLLEFLNYQNVTYKPVFVGDKNELVTDNTKVTSINGWKPKIGLDEGLKLVKEFYD